MNRNKKFQLMTTRDLLPFLITHRHHSLYFGKRLLKLQATGMVVIQRPEQTASFVTPGKTRQPVPPNNQSEQTLGKNTMRLNESNFISHRILNLSQTWERKKNLSTLKQGTSLFRVRSDVRESKPCAAHVKYLQELCGYFNFCMNC